MNKNFTFKQIKDITSVIGGLGSDAIVTTTPSRKKARQGEPIELTSFLLAPGSWIIAGQASFTVEGSSETQIEYQLSLSYDNSNPAVATRHSYMRIAGGASGSPVVIDAIAFDNLTTVRLGYLTATMGAASTLVRDQILIAIKTSDLLIYKP